MQYTVVSILLLFLPLQNQICPSSIRSNISSAKIPFCCCLMPCSLVSYLQTHKCYLLCPSSLFYSSYGWLSRWVLMVYWQPEPRNSCKLRINIPICNSLVKTTRLLLSWETRYFNVNTSAASYLNTQGLNNSCLKSPASTLVDLTFQSRSLRSFSLNQLRNLSL